MGRADGCARPTGRHPLGGRLAGGIRRAVRADGRKGHLHQAQPRRLAGLLLRQIGPGRRHSRRRPHLYLLAFQGQRRTDQQLGRSLRNAPQAPGPLQRLHAWPHHVCPGVLDGTGRLAHVADQRAAYRFALCGGQYAHHGAHRFAGLQRNRRELEAFCALRALRRRTAQSRSERRSLALQP